MPTDFKEALRLKPDMEWARQGILEALRARNLVYRVLLNYFLWMSRLPSQARYGVVFGIYILPRLFHAFAGNNPILRPFADTLLALTVIGLIAWLATRLDAAAFMAGGFASVTAFVATTFSGSTVGVRRLTGALPAVVGLLAFNVTAQVQAARLGRG